MDGLFIVVAVAIGIGVLVLGLADHATWPLSVVGFVALMVAGLFGQALWAPPIGPVVLAAAQLAVPVATGVRQGRGPNPSAGVRGYRSPTTREVTCPTESSSRSTASVPTSTG